MEVTSFEISKKLAEIGFGAEHVFCWYSNSESNVLECGKCGSMSQIVIKDDGLEEVISHHEFAFPFAFPAFGLETILEALPSNIIFSYCGSELQLTKSAIGYYGLEGNSEDGFAIFLEIEKEENESLTDCAAKLLIKLHEKGLIKFGEKHDR